MYLNGFIVNDMRLYFLMQNQHLEPSFQDLIPEKLVIHVFFYTFSSPLQKISNGNHFAYLEPIPTPNFLVDSRYSSKYLKLNSYQKRIQEDKKTNDVMRCEKWI